jgi:hypothetical protein
MSVLMNNSTIEKFKDRGEYFFLCVSVARAKGTPDEAVAASFLRKVMLGLGYPAETASWDDEQTIMYAQNIVMMG